MKRALLVLATLSGLALPALAAFNTWEATGDPFATGTNASVINALAVSPDGQTVYAASGAGTVHRWVYADGVPAGFGFTDQTGVALSTLIESNAITVSGINVTANTSITGGEYEINGSGTWLATPSTVSSGNTVKVRHTSSAGYSATVNTVLTIGTVSDTFSSTTAAIPSHTAPSPIGTGTITATLSGGGAGCAFAAAQYLGVNASPGNTSVPAGVSFPHGLFDFSTNGSCSGSVTVTLTYPQTLPAGTRYWKFGPTATNIAYHWYEMPATINGATTSFTIVDGGLGDDDLTANGTIVDAGGAGSAALDPTAIPTLSEWGMILLSSLLVLFGFGQLRRRAVLAG